MSAVRQDVITPQADATGQELPTSPAASAAAILSARPFTQNININQLLKMIFGLARFSHPERTEEYAHRTGRR